MVHTLTPWARRIESEIKSKLLPTTGGVFAEFQFDHLLRGDLDSRFKAYQTARQAGFLSVNDIRKIENLDHLTELKWLDLSFNMITKIEGLENLTKQFPIHPFYLQHH